MEIYPGPIHSLLYGSVGAQEEWSLYDRAISIGHPLVRSEMSIDSPAAHGFNATADLRRVGRAAACSVAGA